MENSEDIAAPIDFSKIETLLRTKLIELQLKTINLEETQRELSQARQSLYEKERNIEGAGREIALLQTQLDVATAAIRRWEEEKSLNRCQQIQTAMHSKTIMRERDSLLNQTKNLQLENMILKQKINELETIRESREPQEKTLNCLKNNVSLLSKAAEGEISKLRNDLEGLEKSVKDANKLNGRLQAAGMCAHAIQRKYELKIEELEDKLNSMTLFKE